jgi:GABA permease
MAFDAAARSQLWLSLLSWVAVVAVYFVAKTARRKTIRRPSGAIDAGPSSVG